MDGKYIEREFTLTTLDRLIDREKNEDIQTGIVMAKAAIEGMTNTLDLVQMTKLLYMYPDAKLPTGEKLIKVDKASDIMNGVFRLQ